LKEYVLDANALVRLYRDAPGADIVANLIQRAKLGQARLAISVANLSEVLHVLSRYVSSEDALRFIRDARNAIEPVPVDERSALDSAILRIRYKLGFADSFAADLALRRNATLVTADPDFERLGKQLTILALPRHSF
jgi:predicted nucleic acid-binding protein